MRGGKIMPGQEDHRFVVRFLILGEFGGIVIAARSRKPGNANNTAVEIPIRKQMSQFRSVDWIAGIAFITATSLSKEEGDVVPVNGSFELV